MVQYPAMAGGVFHTLSRRHAVCLALLGPLVAGRAEAAAQVERAWLGLHTEHSPEGVRVRRVAEPSPARDGGLAAGDLLVAIDGVRVLAPEELGRVIARLRPGSTVKLCVRRDGRDRLVALPVARHPGEEEALRRLWIGRPAVDLGSTVSVQGSIDEQASKWRGDVVVLEFWASSCASCKALAADLSRWHRHGQARGLRVYGIAGDEPSRAEEAVKSWRVPFAVVADPALETASAYAVSALPTLVVIDRQGVVQHLLIGYDRERQSAIERNIDKLLGP
jgi:peroxiredoxin